MVETYSLASLVKCLFENNEAAENGGAIFVKIRSQITLSNSIFKFNKAKNNGGTISVRQSKATFWSCTFLSESVSMGYGGTIFAENVANITVEESHVYNCTAHYGGFGAIKSESVLNIKNSNLSSNFALKEGGVVYLFQNGLAIGHNSC